MDSQFGLMTLWTQGDWVTRSVALVLLVMSLSSWMVILTKALDLRQIARQARAIEQFWQARDLVDGLRQLGGDARNPFRQLAFKGQEANAHLQRPSETPHLHEALDRNDWLTRCLRSAMDEATGQLQSGLAVLASVGSTAPFVGLFGTVWGIYHALLAIGASGQSTLDKVAGPIGEALIMTALGLAVAIPAVLGYNALVRGNKGVLSQLSRFAYDLHALFVTGARVGSTQAFMGSPVPPVRKD
ncbi:MAG: biopolymer transport protein ExbB [Rhodoferax sp.]|jgi:biopolymer transport protein ExbB